MSLAIFGDVTTGEDVRDSYTEWDTKNDECGIDPVEECVCDLTDYSMQINER